MICCRNTRISASNAARGRNKSTTIPKIILQRSNTPQKIIRFCVSRQLDEIYDRDRGAMSALMPIEEMVSEFRDTSHTRRRPKQALQTLARIRNESVHADRFELLAPRVYECSFTRIGEHDRCAIGCMQRK